MPRKLASYEERCEWVPFAAGLSTNSVAGGEGGGLFLSAVLLEEIHYLAPIIESGQPQRRGTALILRVHVGSLSQGQLCHIFLPCARRPVQKSAKHAGPGMDVRPIRQEQFGHPLVAASCSPRVRRLLSLPLFIKGADAGVDVEPAVHADSSAVDEAACLGEQ